MTDRQTTGGTATVIRDTTPTPLSGPPSGVLLDPITHQDSALYRRFFEREGQLACYGNSWAYITQACRGAGLGMGLKCQGADSLYSVGIHRGHYVVVRPLGVIDERFLHLLRALRERSGQPVFIKKLFPEQVQQLQRLGEFQPAARRWEGGIEPGVYPWAEPSYADDDTFPELIVHLDVSLGYELRPRDWLSEFQQAPSSGRERPAPRSVWEWYRKFRRSLRRSDASAAGCWLEEYHEGMAEEVRSFLIDYFGPTRNSCVDAYQAMLTLPRESGGRQQSFAFVAYQEGVSSLAGFLYLERLDERSAGSYARVVRPGCPGLAECVRVESMRRLRAAGITYLNLGGSECRGLHLYKRQLAPVEQRSMEMLVYGVD